MKIGKTAEKRLMGIFDRMGLLIMVCMCCKKFIHIKRSRGGEGGFSHGLCLKGCEEAREWGFDVGVLK